MNNRVAIITGGSTGIGNALVKEYAQQGYTVFSISRGKDKNLHASNIHQLQFDLSKSEGIEGLFHKIWMIIKTEELSGITLINNAGTLGSIGRLENQKPLTIQKSIALNFTAPMILSALFIDAVKELEVPRNIINISSGAAANPYYGWSIYCSTKAALDMMVKTVGLEQNSQGHGARVLSVYPGVVETAMQEQIRGASAEDFREVQRFKDLKARQQLADPKDVAKKIFGIESSDKYKSGEIIDIRNL